MDQQAAQAQSLESTSQEEVTIDVEPEVDAVDVAAGETFQ